MDTTMTDQGDMGGKSAVSTPDSDEVMHHADEQGVYFVELI
jgi:hypothetical protein